MFIKFHIDWIYVNIYVAVVAFQMNGKIWNPDEWKNSVEKNYSISLSKSHSQISPRNWVLGGKHQFQVRLLLPLLLLSVFSVCLCSPSLCHFIPILSIPLFINLDLIYCLGLPSLTQAGGECPRRSRAWPGCSTRLLALFPQPVPAAACPWPAPSALLVLPLKKL